ncbi:DUF4189 domain-containing protein [Xanthomonas translucens]|uniref:DUF4189 domain-containing protein n=1 Tax=Xanthomonas campestris pv. translucens TaxID=343 RepID=UPI003CE4642D
MKYRTAYTIIVVATLAAPFTLFGQTRCPVGTQAGSAQCLPDDDATPSRPTGEWIKTWGALVRSNQRGGAWSSQGAFSESDARQDALNKCSATGASDCVADATYFNQCIAVAASNEPGVNINTGKDKATAGKRAVADCGKISSSQCVVVFSECTEPVFKKY